MAEEDTSPGQASGGEIPSLDEAAEFHVWIRAWFDRPETRELLIGKVEKDLRNPRGPGLFALKLLAHAYGEPRQVVAVDLNAAAKKVADQTGVPLNDLLQKAAELAVAAGVN